MVFIPSFVHVLKSVWLGIDYLNKLAHMEISGRNKVTQNGKGSVFSNACAFQNSREVTQYSIGFFP